MTLLNRYNLNNAHLNYIVEYIQSNLRNVNFQSTLNPNAAEFVPAFKSAVTSVSTPPEVTAESS